MSNINDGGPAFPIQNDDRPGAYEAHPGMTLRDWFAGHAIVAALARDYGNAWGKEGKEHAHHAARGAYRMADAMLAAREAKP
ncbi:MAG: hypothetical protein M9939_00890 [Mesorhizobium sp.]|nr:hypothetical protein [Mesorhizobium sp.]MCO5159664.1 hypothetical protein [Mesorhizobium sp.]